MSAEYAVRTEGLTKQYGELTAVDGLDMTVEHGEVYGFLGRNGAGKTTTINMLLDFVHPTAGEAQVLGRDAHGESLAIRRRVGVLPEGAELYPRLSAREHVEFAAEIKDATVDTEAVLDRVGLDSADRNRRVSEYSKGMRQRLGLAMALTGDPELLILDEPSSGLDPTGMAEMRDLVREEAGAGTTVFFSSHLLEQVKAVCDRVGILRDGRLVAEDTIDSLRDTSGVNPVVELECAKAAADGLGLETVEGVLDVETEGRWVTATCRDPADKITAIRHADEATTVTDVVAEETSLEALFESYTDEDEEEEVSGEERIEAEATERRA